MPDYNLPRKFVQEVKQNGLEVQRPIKKHRNPLEQDRNALRNKIETDFLKWKGDLEQQVEVKLCRELMSMCFNCSVEFSSWFQRLQPICCRRPGEPTFCCMARLATCNKMVVEFVLKL